MNFVVCLVGNLNNFLFLCYRCEWVYWADNRPV